MYRLKKTKSIIFPVARRPITTMDTLYLNSTNIQYEGHFVNGKGKFTYPSGNVYEGDVVDGKKHGKGKIKSSNGTTHYEGDFADDKKHGKGTFTSSSGDVYEGDFVDGKKHGKCKITITYSNRTSHYEGDVVNGKRHGKGKVTITYSNRTRHYYEGDFVDDKRHGKANITIISSNGNGTLHYEGDVVDDYKHGKGKYTAPNGSIYEGDFVDDKQHGKGTFTYPSSLSVYEGDFVCDKKHGKGNLTIKNGDVYDVYEGDFANDTILSTLVYMYTTRGSTLNLGQWNLTSRTNKQKYTKECPVCFESVDHILLCGHGMCKSCIDRSVTRALFSCPICREKNVMGQPIKR